MEPPAAAGRPPDGPGAFGPTRRPGRVRAYIGLGANLGDAPGRLSSAVRALMVLPGARLRGVSELYRTRPVGPVDQPDFHNAVVGLEVPQGPQPADGALALLMALKDLERALGRHGGPRWGPRELDLDLLVFGRHRILVPRPGPARSDRSEQTGVQWLEVPHASAGQRLFVLAPLADLAPRLVPPGWEETVAVAASRARDREGPDAVRVVGTWDAQARAWTPRGEGTDSSERAKG